MTSPSFLSLNNKRPAVKRGGGIKVLRPYNPLVYVNGACRARRVRTSNLHKE